MTAVTGESIWLSCSLPDSGRPSPHLPIITQPAPAQSGSIRERKAMGLNSGGCFLVKSTEANMMEVRERLSDEETGAGGPEERVLGGGRRGQGSELTEDGGKGLQREGAQHKPRELGIGRDQTNSKDRATVRKTEVSARTRGPVLRCHWGLLTGELLLPLSPSPHHISSTEESGPFQLGARRCQGHGGLSGQAAPPPLPLRGPQAGHPSQGPSGCPPTPASAALPALLSHFLPPLQLPAPAHVANFKSLEN